MSHFLFASLGYRILWLHKIWRYHATVSLIPISASWNFDCLRQIFRSRWFCSVFSFFNYSGVALNSFIFQWCLFHIAAIMELPSRKIFPFLNCQEHSRSDNAISKVKFDLDWAAGQVWSTRSQKAPPFLVLAVSLLHRFSFQQRTLFNSEPTHDSFLRSLNYPFVKYNPTVTFAAIGWTSS